MLINLRNALMSGKRLPYDAEVEYLESTGTQYIDTPFVFNSDTDTVEASFSLLDGAMYKWCFGSHDSNARCAVGSGDGTNLRNVAYWNGTAKVQDSYFLNTRCEFVANSQGAYLNSTKIRNGRPFQATSYMRLFGLHIDGDASTYTSKTRLWRFTARRNGVKVLDLIPVRVGSGASAVGYLYDRVSRKLFGNAGTGDFVLGPDVVPVEYIESHGAGTGQSNGQYIVLPLMSAQKYNIEADIQFKNLGPLIGCWNNNANPRVYYARVMSQDKYALSFYDSYNPDIVSPESTFTRATIRVECDTDMRLYRNGALLGSLTNVSAKSNNWNLWLFANHIQTSTTKECVGCKCWRLDAWDSSTNIKVLGFLPVRVGTEGAMMDVLTRRIYRNQGTGAFTYGNDLKYPIPAS